MSVDLHSHSTASDGSFSPRELPWILKSHGIRIAALTDHDTVGGVKEFIDSCREAGILGTGGIEFSTVFRGREVHLLGYGLPDNDPRWTGFLAGHAAYLRGRCEATLEKLRSYGYDLDIEEVYKESDGNPPMPPHILKVLGKKLGIWDVGKAVVFFKEFLEFGAKAWVDHGTELEAPLGALIDSGALAIVGHPGRFPDLQWLEDILDLGAHGFELWYPDHTGRIFDELAAIARKRDCIVTGGSDYHGAFSERRLGEVDVPIDAALRFLEAIGQEVPADFAIEGRTDK
jgi:predicted metal-dependent phosphoesterase TrpH